MFEDLAQDMGAAGTGSSGIGYSLHDLCRDLPETLCQFTVIQKRIPFGNLTVRPVLAGDSRGTGTGRQ